MKREGEAARVAILERFVTEVPGALHEARLRAMACAATDRCQPGGLGVRHGGRGMGLGRLASRWWEGRGKQTGMGRRWRCSRRLSVICILQGGMARHAK